ncbi:divergent polysaccharide deacetylase family protein [Paenibacillus filicis]|uniref:Divergent polysaccharide deacetylase family protein n=1 Tax=Paenibacillus filicis TaxID=669464 RepID=A0ABU9DR16_9BACL
MNLKSAALLMASLWMAAWISPPATVASPLKPKAAEETPDIRRVALVIDDFGNDMQGTTQMMELSVPFAAAVMPFLPTTKRDAEWAHRIGQTVLVHVPMEPNKGKPEWLGPGAITVNLTDEEVRQRIIAAIEDVPHAVGINNHMGSKVTADERIMRIILTVCKEKGLFMLDSRTTDKSVVGKLAAELGVPTAANNMFMDDVYTRSHIAKQAVKLQKLAASQPNTIVIGHVGAPGKHTSDILKQTIPSIQQAGAKFVPISEMMH